MADYKAQHRAPKETPRSISGLYTPRRLAKPQGTQK